MAYLENAATMLAILSCTWGRRSCSEGIPARDFCLCVATTMRILEWGLLWRIMCLSSPFLSIFYFFISKRSLQKIASGNMPIFPFSLHVYFLCFLVCHLFLCGSLSTRGSDIVFPFRDIPCFGLVRPQTTQSTRQGPRYLNCSLHPWTSVQSLTLSSPPACRRLPATPETHLHRLASSNIAPEEISRFSIALLAPSHIPVRRGYISPPRTILVFEHKPTTSAKAPL